MFIPLKMVLIGIDPYPYPSGIVLRTRNAAVVEVVGRQLAALLLELHAIALPGQRSNGLESFGEFLVDLWCGSHGGCGELDGELNGELDEIDGEMRDELVGIGW
jgi:hypothetical protein